MAIRVLLDHGVPRESLASRLCDFIADLTLYDTELHTVDTKSRHSDLASDFRST